jgi:DNA phosphorothioation-dependent restriction protein DptG
MKTPTLAEKVIQYEKFLHKINSLVTACNHEGVRELVQNADSWSYSHRVGNGEMSDRKQQQLIDVAFRKLLDTPKADKETEERQKAWQEVSKEKEKAFMKNI